MSLKGLFASSNINRPNAVLFLFKESHLKLASLSMVFFMDRANLVSGVWNRPLHLLASCHKFT